MKPVILVVDDEPDFLELVKGWLEPRFRVLTSEGGPELDRPLAEMPDLVLLDIHLRERDAFDFCKRLRADSRAADVPVLFLTGSTADEDFLLFLDAGGNRYLTKPISKGALLDAVSLHLRAPVRT